MRRSLYGFDPDDLPSASELAQDAAEDRRRAATRSNVPVDIADFAPAGAVSGDPDDLPF